MKDPIEQALYREDLKKDRLEVDPDILKLKEFKLSPIVGYYDRFHGSGTFSHSLSKLNRRRIKQFRIERK